MRRCPVCKLALRGNDPSASMLIPADNAHGAQGGFYMGVCADCRAVYDDGFTPTEVYIGVYGGNVRTPLPASDGTYGDVPPGACGVCRRHAREDDAMQGLRLWREDLTVEEAARLIPEGQEHAHYVACGECRRHYAPAILRRLKGRGLVPDSLTVGQMGLAHFV